MSRAITLDTHENVKKLIATGFTEEQAEVQTKIIAEIVNEQGFTKQYLDERLKELEYRLIIRLGVMIVVAIGVISILVKIL